jgi:hypothetical protein
MKTRGIKDLYLPLTIARHVKYLLFCAAFTPIWGLIMKVELAKSFLLPTFLMMFVMMEILSPLANRLFEYKSHNTPNGITQNYLTRLLLFFIFIMILASIIFAIFVIIFNLTQGYGFPDLPLILKKSLGVFKVVAIALFFTTPMFFFIPWQQSMKREFELREQNLIFQNETLKNQVNPHFLFNSLNTLSSLVNTEAAVAGQFIAKLSVIYRYILDNSSKIEVPLKEELKFIRDYFYLHQIRNEGKIELEININDEGYSHKILPISLQLLIENAIKHNMATQNSPLIIKVYLEEHNIVVKNNVQKMATQVVSTKIGLKNLNERVRLVTGKEIIVTETEDLFSVKAPLIL